MSSLGHLKLDVYVEGEIRATAPEPRCSTRINNITTSVVVYSDEKQEETGVLGHVLVDPGDPKCLYWFGWSDSAGDPLGTTGTCFQLGPEIRSRIEVLIRDSDGVVITEQPNLEGTIHHIHFDNP